MLNPGKRLTRQQTFLKTQAWLFMRCLACIFAAGAALFTSIDKQNELTELRLAIPVLANKVKKMHEENRRLKYEIDKFESPIHLMELMRNPEFGHLKYPYLKDVIFIPLASNDTQGHAAE